MRKVFLTKLLLAVFHLFVLFNPQRLFCHLPSGFAQYEIATGLNPTDMAIAPDGRIFITEKNGLVRVVQGEELLLDPFAVIPVNDFNERGLSHITLDPAFAQNGYVYVYYTVPDGSHNRLSRLTAAGNLAAPGSETVLYECDARFGTVHHGGAMAFGLDGKLYLAVGENSSGFQGPQSLNSDLGKVLRLNPDGSIPSDNPFYQQASGKYRSIYALGLRNPFSLTIDPVTGKMFIGDVGGTEWEEINELRPGANYGFPILEGKAGGQNLPPDYQDPLYAYHHLTGCAISALAYYHPSGGNFPSNCRKKLFFADYCKGFIGQYDPVARVWERNFVTDAARPVCIKTAPDGSFYYLARAGLGGGSEVDNTASDNGSLWRVVYTGSDAPFIYLHPKSHLYAQGDSAVLSVLSLGEGPLGYIWQKNGVTLQGQDQSSLRLYNLSLADSGAVFRCVVTNEHGYDTSKTAEIRVTTNQRPQPVIILPDSFFRYRANDTLFFKGFATDAEQGALDDSSLTWRIYFHHDTHFHPGLSPTTGISEGAYFIEPVGEPSDNVWYRVILTATDHVGLQTSVHRDIFPQKTEILVETRPSGVEVDIDGIRGYSPFLILGVAGLQRTAVVPDFVLRSDSVLLFREWQDGLTTHEYPFVTPADSAVRLVGHYDTYAVSDGFGLLGSYLREWLSEPAYRTQIDSFIDFKWGEGAPYAGMPVDNFTIRWEGTVTPYFSDTLTFYTQSDDGARLWVNDSLLIDQFIPQPNTEHSARLFLEGGKKYPIRLEFLEAYGGATVHLSWSSARLPKATIPATQLHPPKPYLPNALSGRIWLDENGDQFWNPEEIPLKNAVIVLSQLDHPSANYATLSDAQGFYQLSGIPSGNYSLYTAPPAGYGALQPGAGLDAFGYGADLSLSGDERISSDFAYIPESVQRKTGRVPSWQILPNPADGKVTFSKNSASLFRDLSVRIFDMRGKLVVETEAPAKVRDTTIQLSALPAGTYAVVADGFARMLIIRR